MRQREHRRPRAHDGHAPGDVGGLGGAFPPSEVGHGDDGEQRADVVRARDQPGLGGVEAEAALEGRDDNICEDHALGKRLNVFIVIVKLLE